MAVNNIYRRVMDVTIKQCKCTSYKAVTIK